MNLSVPRNLEDVKNNVFVKHPTPSEVIRPPVWSFNVQCDGHLGSQSPGYTVANV